MHIAAVTIGEIQVGIEATRQSDTYRAQELETWLNQISETYNILPMDGEAFRIWGKFMHRQQEHLMTDAMLAACAHRYGLTVVTRNTKHLEMFGVKLLNPFIKV